jgi:thioredoxin 1
MFLPIPDRLGRLSSPRLIRQRSVVFLATVALFLAGCQAATGESSAPSPAQNASAPATASDSLNAQATPTGSGFYVTLAEYEGNQDAFSSTEVVVFFNAAWCSTCKEARDNIEADLAAIPPDLTIVVADFDTEIDLRRTYGVTVQHTFVHIDPQGNEISKWSGSVTTEQIYERVR